MLLTIFILLVCIVVALAGAPLAMRKVPPNEVYGLRTYKTRRSEETWYEVNAFAGAAAMIAAGVTAILLMVYNGTWFRAWWAQLLLLIVVMGAAAIATFVFERRR